MNRLPQTLPPDAEVLRTWVLDSTAELKGLRNALSQELSSPVSDDRDELGDVPERMLLVATELAANAILHGRAPTRVQLMRADGLYLLDVADHDPETVPTPNQADQGDLGGRGLALALSFSLDVGWYPTPSTKHVWATFTTSRK
jgi:serine/threonine-protein kinase RsbW